MANKLTLELALANWEATRSDDAKKAFHRLAKKALKDVTDFLALRKGTFDIRVCKGGPAVLGEVILHTRKFYVCLSEHSYYRKCSGRKDYVGEQNHDMHVSWLATEERKLSTAITLHNLSGLGNARVMVMLDVTTLPNLKIHEIADIISATWHNVSPYASLYLTAMHYLETVHEFYGVDSGETVVAYFLENAQTYQGAIARLVKAELKRRIK